MIEKQTANQEQLAQAKEIMSLLSSTKKIELEDGSKASVEVNKAYLNDDMSISLDELSDNPEDNAGFININDCQYYIHFGTLINSKVEGNKIFFPKNMIPPQYKGKGLDYLYLDKDLILVLK